MCPGGYYDDMELEEKLEIFSKIKGLTGLVVFYPTAPLPEDPDKIVKLLKDYNLEVSVMEPEVWADRKWKHGGFSTTEKQVRKDIVRILKESIDLAKELDAESVLLWPAHDGFDYPFQTNYRLGWDNLVETVREIGEYDSNVKITIEAKAKDPRQKQYISDTGKALTFVNEVGLDNVGCALDLGHALAAGESLAESVMLLDKYDKLFQIHLNDNYKDADPDMIIGTINFWEVLEFFYYLDKTDYESWSTLDIIAGRDDRIKSLEMATKLTLKYKEMADKLDKHRSEIEENLKGYKFAENLDILTEILF